MLYVMNTTFLGHQSYDADTDNLLLGICHPIRQTDFNRLEVYSSSFRQLQEAVYNRLVYNTTATGLQWRRIQHASTLHRQLTASRLEWADGKPGQVWPGQHQSAVRHHFHYATLCTIRPCGGKGREAT
jgi:hypothetical protein